MSEESSREVNQQTGAAIPPARGEVTDDTLREYPFIVPWTQGDYINPAYPVSSQREHFSPAA